MIKASTIKEVRDNVTAWKKAGESIAVVPTMGYLHEGHESLIKKARSENDRVIVTDFVNPTQFGPNEDLETYPRDFDRDCALCEKNGVDLVFHPTPEEMYFPDKSTTVHVSGLTEGLCGASRPIHFDGVCLVVNKLFNISGADRAYFGQKDAQQLATVRRMVRDLSMPIEIVGCPIVREEDGLAKSSRNVRLTEAEREVAPGIYKSLCGARDKYEKGETSVSVLANCIKEGIEAIPGTRIDYVEIVSWDDLKPIDKVTGPALVAVAVHLGAVRLIDNIILGNA